MSDRIDESDLNSVLGIDSPEDLFGDPGGDEEHTMEEAIEHIRETLINHATVMQSILAWVGEEADEPELIRLTSRIRGDLELDKLVIGALCIMAQAYLDDTEEGDDDAD